MDPAADRPTGTDAPPSKAGQIDVFISYARRPTDREFVDWLCESLEQEAKHVWLDRSSIEPGADWRQRIERGIEAATSMVVVITPESVQSPECAREIETAARSHKRIIPVVLRSVAPDQLPDSLTKPNWIDFQRLADRPHALAQLLEALDADIDWRDAHARLAGRARQWSAAGRDRSFLLRGNDLRTAEDWYGEKGQHKEQPTDEQYGYISASRRGSTRRQRAVLGAVALGLVVSLCAAVFAFVQRQQAVDQSHQAQSEAMSAEATNLFGANTPIGILLSIQAYERFPTSQASQTLAHSSQERLKGILDDGSAIEHSVAFSPDGRTVVTGDDGHTTLWNMDTRTRTARWDSGAGASVWSVAFSPDGKTVASGATNGRVTLRTLSTGAETIWNEGSTIQSVAFSPDGTTLAVGDDKGRVVLWNMITGAKTTWNDGSIVFSVDFSPDGKTLATGDGSGQVVLWNLATGDKTTLNDDSRVESVAFSPDGKTIATGDTQGQVVLWDLTTGVKTILSDGSEVLSVAFSPDGNSVASGDIDGLVVLWNLATGAKTTWNDGTTVFVAFSPDGGTLATADGGGQIVLWDVNHWIDPGGPVSAAFSPVSNTLATGDGSGQVVVRNVATGAKMTSQRLGSVHDLAFSPDGSTIATGDDSGHVVLWNLKTGVTTSWNDGSPVYVVAFSPDGKTLATGDLVGKLALWDPTTGTKRKVTDLGNANTFAFSPDGKTLAVAEPDGRTILTDIATGTKRTFNDGNSVDALAFSPDGATLATGDGNGRVTVRDLANGTKTTMSDGSTVVTMAFSPDGTLATADTDGEAILWREAAGTKLILNDDNSVWAIAFSHDGSLLATGDVDGQVNLRQSFVWNGRFSALKRSLCTELGRFDMSPAQWSAYVPKQPYQKTCT